MKTTLVLTTLLAISAAAIFQVQKNAPVTNNTTMLMSQTPQLREEECGKGSTVVYCKDNCEERAAKLPGVLAKITEVCEGACKTAGIFGYRRLLEFCANRCNKYFGEGTKDRENCRSLCFSVFNCGVPEDPDNPEF